MEISNKTLASILVLAVAISLFGTILSVDRLGKINVVKQQPTIGYASSPTGIAEVQINTTSSIKFAVATVNWTSGSVNSSYINCTMDTVGDLSSGCIGFHSVTQPLILENDGNVPVNVSLRATSSNSTFIGGTLVGGGPEFMYNVTVNEINSCGDPVPAAWTDVNLSSPGTLICPYLDYTDGNDSLKIGLWINIPYTVSSGIKSNTLIATAST
jgi:hypothetical protein